MVCNCKVVHIACPRTGHAPTANPFRSALSPLSVCAGAYSAGSLTPPRSLRPCHLTHTQLPTCNAKNCITKNCLCSPICRKFPVTTLAVDRTFFAKLIQIGNIDSRLEIVQIFPEMTILILLYKTVNLPSLIMMILIIM